MDFLMTLTYTKEKLCGDLSGVVGLIGWIILIIKIAVPIIIIIIGMFDLGKAVTAKDEPAIKKAQDELLKKVAAGVCVFLVATIITILMRILGSEEWKDCVSTCIDKPWDSSCRIVQTIGE